MHSLGRLLRVFSLLGVGVVATFGARGNVHELVEVVADFVATRPPLLPLVEDGGSRVVAARLVGVARLGESVPAPFVAARLFGVGVGGVSRRRGPLRLGLGSDVRGLRLRGPRVVRAEETLPTPRALVLHRGCRRRRVDAHAGADAGGGGGGCFTSRFHRKRDGRRRGDVGAGSRLRGFLLRGVGSPIVTQCYICLLHFCYSLSKINQTRSLRVHYTVIDLRARRVVVASSTLVTSCISYRRYDTRCRTE